MGSAEENEIERSGQTNKNERVMIHIYSSYVARAAKLKIPWYQGNRVNYICSSPFFP